jgi:hypothetical protein
VAGSAAGAAAVGVAALLEAAGGEADLTR